MIFEIISIIFTLFWAYALYVIGQKLEPSIFYTILYGHLGLIILYLFYVIPNILNIISFNFSFFTILLSITFIFERIGWGVALNEVAGDENISWFYVIYLIPLSWIIYRITMLK